MPVNFGINVSPFNYFQSQWPSPDLWPCAPLFDVANTQTTLAADHAQGSGYFVVANPRAFYGFSTLPGDALAVSFGIPTVTGVVKGTGWMVAGLPTVFVTSFTSGADAAFPAGTIVDNIGGNAWQNTDLDPANWPLAAGYVDGTGRPTGYPAGLKTGQRVSLGGFAAQVLSVGTYTLVANGTGSVLVSPSYTDGTTNNPVTITFVAGVASGTFSLLSSSASNILWIVETSSASDPLRDLRVVMPDRPGQADGFTAAYAAHQADPSYFAFHPDFLASLAPFTCLRAMDLLNTNSGLVADWADRSPAGTTFGLDRDRGVPYEWLTTLAGATGAALWFNVPTLATDAYVATLAAFLRDNTTGPVHVEWSNETWNSGFPQYGYATVAGCMEFSPSRVMSLTYSSGTGLVTAVHPAHGFADGATVQVANATDMAYDGAYVVAVVDANTYTYTPAAPPGASPAVARPYHRLMAYDVAGAGVLAVTGLAYNLTSANAKITVTTATPHGWILGDVVQLVNATDPAFDQVVRIKGPTATTFDVDLALQGSPRPLPAIGPGATTVAASAVAGRSLRAVRVGANSAHPPAPQLVVSTAGRLYHGRRAAQVHAAVHAPFGAQAGRLVYELTVGANGLTDATNSVYPQYLADLGGALLTPGTTAVAPAAYFITKPSTDQTYLGTARPIASLTSAGGVATAACPAHGLAPGMPVQVVGAAPDGYCGVFAVPTVVDPDTFAYPVAGTPASPATSSGASPVGVAALVGGPYFREVTALTLAGGVATATSAGHGFAVGQPIRLANAARAADNAAYTVSAATATTFSFPTPAAAAPTPAAGHLWAYPQAAVSAVLADATGNATSGPVTTQIDGYAAFAAARGLALELYEAGQSLVATIADSNWPPLTDLYTAANRDPVMGAVYAAFFGGIAARDNPALVCHYDHISPYTKTGSWSLLESQHQDPATAPKWSAVLDLITPPSGGGGGGSGGGGGGGNSGPPAFVPTLALDRGQLLPVVASPGTAWPTTHPRSDLLTVQAEANLAPNQSLPVGQLLVRPVETNQWSAYAGAAILPGSAWGLLRYAAVSDADGNITDGTLPYGKPWQGALLSTPIYVRGFFDSRQVIGLDAAALAAMGGRFVDGSLVAGGIFEIP